MSAFQVGEVYDLPATLGTYLVITASAIPVEVGGSRFVPFETRIDMPPTVRAVAHERRPRRRKSSRGSSS